MKGNGKKGLFLMQLGFYCTSCVETKDASRENSPHKGMKLNASAHLWLCCLGVGRRVFCGVGTRRVARDTAGNHKSAERAKKNWKWKVLQNSCSINPRFRGPRKSWQKDPLCSMSGKCWVTVYLVPPPLEPWLTPTTERRQHRQTREKSRSDYQL